jgi:hypothetical protein
VRRTQYPVVKRLLEGIGVGLDRREPFGSIVDGQAEPVSAGGVGQVKRAERRGQFVGVAFLQAQRINVEAVRKAA